MLQKVTVRGAVEFAMRTEELGGMFYKKLAEHFADDAEIRGTFELLAKDEALHRRQFSGLLEKLPKEESAEDDDERYGYLRALSMTQFFSGEKGLYREFGRIKDKSDALLKAADLEKATLQFYMGLLDVLGRDDTLLAIIKTEKAHLMKVTQYLLTDAKFRGFVDDF